MSKWRLAHKKGELGLALEVLTQRFSAPTNLLFLLHLLVGGGQLSILLVVNAFGRVGVLVQCLHLTKLMTELDTIQIKAGAGNRAF